MLRFSRVAMAALGVAAVALSAAPAAGKAPSAEALALGEALGKMKANAAPGEVYTIWNGFCKAHFGAENEPLVYKLYGDKLAEMAGGEWTHVSLSSACVAWETNLPATSWVEYGPTEACKQATAKTERPFYIHVHYLKDLPTGKPTYLRRVSVDERGNRIASPVRKVVPACPPGAVLLPGKLAGPPYVLDKAGATYVLTADVNAKRRALEITADGITLDLNGHTVTYHNETLPEELFTNEWTSHETHGAEGVRDMGHGGLTLLNGLIREGPGKNSGNKESTGFIPVYLRGAGKFHVAGVSVDYWTGQNTGMRIRGATDDVEIHHCVFLDRGCRIRNRHGAAVRAVSFLGSTGANYRVHHNLVKRTRQMGILGPHVLAHNELYTDSWSVNSFSLAVYNENGVAHHNRVFGTGVNVQGFGWAKKNAEYHHNLIHLQGIATGKNRGKEGWGDQDSLNGFRVTNYGKGGQKRDNLLYHDNVIVIRCRGGSQARGTEFFSDETITDLVCRDNTIKVVAEDDKTAQVACVVTHGQPAKADTALPVWYRNCTLIANLCHVRFGDYYGKGSNHHFVNCEFVREGDDPRYHAFIVDGAYWSKRHVLLDCTFGPGVKWDDVLWKRTGRSSFYSVKWTLDLTTTPGAAVTVKDKDGAVEFEGKADAKGKAAIPLTQCVMRMPPKVKLPTDKHVKDMKTPHTVTVAAGGKTASKAVEMTGKQSLEVRP